MENKTTHTTEATATNTRKDIHQQVTDTIIRQLEAGTVPWHKPWKGNDRLFSLPKNVTTGNKYRGINILLLWSSAIAHDFPVQEWASFKQWQGKGESIRKGEKGSMIVYYDTMEKEVDGENKKIPFLKSSMVFNRSQLASSMPPENDTENDTNSVAMTLFQKIERVDSFVQQTEAVIEHKESTACYIPSADKINMPVISTFMHTETCTPTEGYYSTLFHELTHWTGSKHRLDRTKGKKFGDANYATEELVAELGAAFLCAEFEITATTKTDHASYIAHWLKVLQDNKHCVITAASEASKAVGYLQELQPKD